MNLDLLNKPLVSKLGVETAENEPQKEPNTRLVLPKRTGPSTRSAKPAPVTVGSPGADRSGFMDRRSASAKLMAQPAVNATSAKLFNFLLHFS